MENLYERVQRLCDNRKITIAALERECGLGNATVKKWGVSTPSGDRLTKVADYFGVSVDYLLGREITKKDEKDIQKKLNKIMAEIQNKEDSPLYYNGEEIDEVSLELLADALESAMRQMKIINKEKFNPNKNKDKE